MIDRAQVDNSISGSPWGTPLTTRYELQNIISSGKNNHTYDCEYVICYKYNDSCHKRLGVIKQRERYSEMSALLQTLTRERDVETADTSIQATWQLTNKITDDEIVLFDFYFACNVTWYGLTTEKRQDKRKKRNNLNELI